MPDECHRIHPRDDSGSEQAIDVAEMVGSFAHYLPAWTGGDGLPLSWTHYVAGLRWIARHTMRQQVYAADSTRLGGAKADDYTRWRGAMARALHVRGR